MRIHPEDIKEELLSAGMIARRALSDAESRCPEEVSLEQFLIEEGIVAPSDIRRIKANLSGLPFVKLSVESIPEEVITVLPEPLVRKLQAVPFAKEGRVLEVALLDPDVIDALLPYEEKLSVRILPRLTDESSIKKGLLKYQQILKSSTSFAPKEGDAMLPALFKHAFLSEATVIHLEQSGEAELVIRYRILGILAEALRLSGVYAKRLMSEVYEVAKLSSEEFGASTFSMVFDEKKYTVRVASLPLAGGKRITMSFSEEAAGALDEFLMSENLREEIERALFERRGLFLIVGNTEKQSLLESIISLSQKRSVVCVGEELRKKYPTLSIKEGIPLRTAAKAAVRQDPDILALEDAAKGALPLMFSLASRALIIASVSFSTPEEALEYLQDKVPQEILATTSLHIVGVEGSEEDLYRGTIRGISSF